nr:MAG TPA: hypothetical protein [Caudoviricetes sp.]
MSIVFLYALQGIQVLELYFSIRISLIAQKYLIIRLLRISLNMNIQYTHLFLNGII